MSNDAMWAPPWDPCSTGCGNGCGCKYDRLRLRPIPGGHGAPATGAWSPPAPVGWICPRCRVVHAPTVLRCLCTD